MLLRVLWVPPAVRGVLSGENYSEDELREAGLDPAKMLAHGEAEQVSPKAAEPHAKKKK